MDYSSRDGYFTIPQVFADLGFEPNKHETWAAGDRVRMRYVDATGSLPPKDLRQKTNGPGSHCFAIYPPEWRATAEAIVLQIATTRAAQGRLV